MLNNAKTATFPFDLLITIECVCVVFVCMKFFGSLSGAKQLEQRERIVMHVYTRACAYQKENRRKTMGSKVEVVACDDDVKNQAALPTATR